MIRVFPERTSYTPTDALAFVGDPSLFRPPEQSVMVSVTFSWDKPEGERLARSWRRFYKDVRIGGPAYDDPGMTFTPGVFTKHGITFTSRGCPNRCPWCVVPKREGQLRLLPISDGWIVNDNNLLACPRQHIEAVFKMLEHQPNGPVFRGGLEAGLLEKWHVNAIEALPRKATYWLACDSDDGIEPLKRAAKLLQGISRGRLRCYTMIGFKEGPDDAEKRLREVWSIGFIPHAQVFRKPNTDHRLPSDPEWQRLQRNWSRPAIMRARMKGATMFCDELFSTPSSSAKP
ncbi:MAG: hypothetical protein ABIJ57_10955 [Pseudomonadota bacterium]